MDSKLKSYWSLILTVALSLATTVSARAAFDYEPFAYTGTTLNGQNGGTGWIGPWIQTGTSPSQQLSNDNVSLSYPNTWQPPLVPPTPTGSRVRTGGIQANSSRLLSQPIDLSVDGNTRYISALFRKNTANGGTVVNDNLLIEFYNSPTGVRRFGLGIEGAQDRPWLNANGSTTGPTSVVSSATYFLVAKIVSSASGLDQASLWVFAGSGSGYSTQVPILEPVPVATLTQNTAAILDRIRLRIDSANSLPGEVDEIRIGDTWSSVTAAVAVPEPVACLVWLGTLVSGAAVVRRFVN